MYTTKNLFHVPSWYVLKLATGGTAPHTLTNLIELVKFLLYVLHFGTMFYLVPASYFSPYTVSSCIYLIFQ